MSNEKRIEEGLVPVNVRLHLASGRDIDTLVWADEDADEDEVLGSIKLIVTDQGLFQGHGWVEVGGILVHTKAVCAFEVL